ncbi:sensor histidine kinase [uncultured Winogradskyella sp.]|uniref:sensor histidine kinase n=1 Tax=uncultured Winogradskyella sp. TaxID=395353 RepID=UPI002624018E|nr:sensor histidine kinase [uncultured Winogradskyella sp.]
MAIKHFKKYSIIAQVALWLIYLSSTIVFDASAIGFWTSFAFSLSNVMAIATIVYFHYFKLLPLLVDKNYFWYLIFTILTILIVGFTFAVLDNNLPFDYPITHSFWDSIIFNVLQLSLFIIISSMFYFVHNWYLKREKEDELKLEKLRAELNFLRSQINPHFLFNTLNNIYSYAQTGNEKTAPMLEKLSGILRFMVYDCNNATVELNKEIEAIENLLEIHRMKNSTQNNIIFNYQSNKGFHLVAPLILINLVENACKHSDTVSNRSGFIKIVASVLKDNKLVFSISNSIKKKSNSTTLKYGGMGLENITKRLELLYENDYFMEEDIKNNVYHLQLEIPLMRKG